MKKSFIIGLGIAAMTLAAGSAFAYTPPTSSDLLFSLDHNSLGADGSKITSWGGMTAMDNPIVEVINGTKWEKNTALWGEIWGDWDNNPSTNWTPKPHDSKFQFDGFRLPGNSTTSPSAPAFDTPINANGASIVMAVRPVFDALPTTDWSSLVDIFYDELVLGIKRNTGQIVVRRKGWMDVSSAANVLVDGQATVLSLTVQANGQYKVWANGNQIMDIKDTAGPSWWNGGASFAMTSLNPGGIGRDQDFKHYINVGRNNPDGWSAFNGNIGDTAVYTSALSDAQRQSLESNIASSMGISAPGIAPVPEPTSILAAISILGPAGMMFRRRRK